jgi:hypothetical protein
MLWSPTSIAPRQAQICPRLVLDMPFEATGQATPLDSLEMQLWVVRMTDTNIESALEAAVVRPTCWMRC